MIVKLLAALLLTIVIEELVAIAAGFRQKELKKLIALVNIITNPILNYVLLLIWGLSTPWIYWTCVSTLEVLVIILEWGLLCYGLRSRSRKLLWLSMGMNMASVTTGVILVVIMS